MDRLELGMRDRGLLDQRDVLSIHVAQQVCIASGTSFGPGET